MTGNEISVFLILINKQVLPRMQHFGCRHFPLSAHWLSGKNVDADIHCTSKNISNAGWHVSIDQYLILRYEVDSFSTHIKAMDEG